MCIAGVALASLFVSANAVRADQVNAGGRTYTHGRVTALAGGFVTFREDSGSVVQLPIESIERLYIDARRGMDDFNQAEELLAAGDSARSLVPYERALRSMADGFWPDLVTCRLLVANDRAGRVDRATSQFIRTLRGQDSGPTAAARLIPNSVPARRDESSVRAVESLDEAIRGSTDETQSALLKLLRYRILAAVADPRAEAERLAITSMTLPAILRTRPAYDIVIDGLQTLLHTREDAADLARLDRAMGEAPPAVLPDLLLLKGRVLAARARSREEMIRAAWPFMRVAVHMPDDPRAAVGLYETALMMERLERQDKALRLLDECLAMKIADDDVRASAQKAVQRIKAAAP